MAALGARADAAPQGDGGQSLQAVPAVPAGGFDQKSFGAFISQVGQLQQQMARGELSVQPPQQQAPDDRKTLELPAGASLVSALMDKPAPAAGQVGHMYHFQDELEGENTDDKIGDEALDKLLVQFKSLDCEGRKATAAAQGQSLDYLRKGDEGEDFCKQDLRNEVLAPISQVDMAPLPLFNYLNKNIYGPLGYKYYEKFAYPDLLSDLIFLNGRYSMIHPETPVPVFGDFRDGVLRSFSQIADYSADFHHNKALISSSIVDLLKQFHIWWNVHRQKNQMGHVHKHTFDIIRNVMLRYKQTHDAMKATTVHILKNVKDAYYRFVKADRMFAVLKQNPADMIAAEILRRYKNNIENIHAHKSSYELRVTETAYMLDLLRAFFVVNYKRRVTDDENQLHYEAAVYNRVVAVFKDYKKYLVEIGSESYNDFKDFTATLLLKMNQRAYFVFRMATMAGYVNLPAFNLDTSVASAIKIYYEFFDNMSVVPNECLDLMSAALQDCMAEKANKLVMFMYQKYLLYASVAGADLLAYLRNNVAHIGEALQAARSFDSYIGFRNNYFAELFKFAVRYRHRYQIRDMGAVDDLENELGFEIEKSKKIHAISKINYDLIDKLDRRFYELFLNVKTKFNRYGPVEKDVKVLTLIGKAVQRAMEKYRDDEKSKLDANIEAVLGSCAALVDAWLKRHSVQYVVNADPLNAETPFTQYMPLPEAHSNIVQHVIDEPTVQSLRVEPLKSMMPQ